MATQVWEEKGIQTSMKWLYRIEITGREFYFILYSKEKTY